MPVKQQSPDSKGKGKARDTGDSDDDAQQGSSAAVEPAEQEPELSEEERECAKMRAVLNSNIGACYVKLVSSIVY